MIAWPYIRNILFPEQVKEEKRVLTKAREKGLESLTDEERKTYQQVWKHMLLM